jgi:hypothetical protein
MLRDRVESFPYQRPFESLKGGSVKIFETSSESKSLPSRTRKPSIYLVSDQLTNSEIEQLQRNKLALSEYARKAFAEMEKAKEQEQVMPVLPLARRET